MRRAISRADLQEHLIKRAWEDENFKGRLLNDPTGVVEKELYRLTGKRIRIAKKLKIYVHPEKAGELHLILPEARDVFASSDKDLVVFWENVLRT